MCCQGLKSQHVTAIEWLAMATNANVKGLEVGSKTLEFSPNRGPGELQERNITITAASPAASALLIFQAVFPFLLFAGNAKNEPIELTISGGTNVSFSLSYEYLDQVLLPALEAWFGARVERRLQQRGWSTGRASRGSLWFKIYPLPVGTALQLKDGLAESLAKASNDVDVDSIDITIITPSDLHAPLEAYLREDLETLFPDAQLNFRPPEESGHDARIYVLAVAQSSTSNMRWGRDCLYSGKRKGKKIEVLCREVSRAVTKDLAGEIHRGGVVDEFLQDQLVVFQALAQGRTSFPRCSVDGEQSDTSQKGAETIDEVGQELRGLHMGDPHHRLKKDRCRGPLGDAESDSSHTQTARWVAWEVLEPRLTWFNHGVVCEGIGLRSGS